MSMTVEDRIAELEQRVMALEKNAQIGELFRDESLMRTEKELIDMHGKYVDKSTAARILGVTRATVYAMLADGRIEGACSGRRVDVRSIARYLCAGEKPKNRRNRHGLDTLEEA